MEQTPGNFPEKPDSGGLFINAEIKNHLSETAKWGKFLGVIGFVLVGLMIIFAFGAGFFMNRFYQAPLEQGNEPSGAGAIVMVVYLLAMAGIYFFPSFYIFQFAVKIQNALYQNKESELQRGFSRLKSFFKFWGIVAIIGMILYFLGIIGAIIFYTTRNAISTQ